jgi:glycosyltransferase involved in cell wall biosynthesis
MRQDARRGASCPSGSSSPAARDAWGPNGTVPQRDRGVVAASCSGSCCDQKSMDGGGNLSTHRRVFQSRKSRARIARGQGLSPWDFSAYSRSNPAASRPHVRPDFWPHGGRERYKGHDLLLEIWPKLVEQVSDAALFIAGDGNDRERLETKAVGLGLKDSVKFLGRVLDQTLEDLYRDCLFFVMPSRHEGFGLVFLEAMQAGKTCIGGMGAAAEVIEHGVTGLVVDPGDAEQVLGAVLRLFQEPGIRA